MVHILLALSLSLSRWIEKLSPCKAFFTRAFSDASVELGKKYSFAWIQNPLPPQVSLLLDRFSIHRSILILAGLNTTSRFEFRKSNAEISIWIKSKQNFNQIVLDEINSLIGLLTSAKTPWLINRSTGS